MTSRDSARLARARRLVAALGVEPVELLGSRPRGVEAAPKAFLPRMRAAATPTMIGSYGTRRIDAIRVSDILAWMHQLQQNAQHRGSGRRDGRHAAIHGLHALRAFYRLAVADGLLDPDDNLAARVRLPRRLPSTRRALTTVELAAINLDRRDHRPRPGAGLSVAAAAHRNHLPTRRRRRPAIDRSRRRVRSSPLVRRVARSDGSRSPRLSRPRSPATPPAAVSTPRNRRMSNLPEIGRSPSNRRSNLGHFYTPRNSSLRRRTHGNHVRSRRRPTRSRKSATRTRSTTPAAASSPNPNTRASSSATPFDCCWKRCSRTEWTAKTSARSSAAVPDRQRRGSRPSTQE
jgi:hypothetical protein